MGTTNPVNLFPDTLGFMYEHQSNRDWMKGFDDLKDWTNVFQVFLSSPKEFVMPDMERVTGLALRKRENKIIPVVHGPYFTTLVKEGPAQKFTTNWIKMCVALLNSVGLQKTPIVIHTGKPAKERDSEEVQHCMLRYLEQLSNTLERSHLRDYNICFETDAGKNSVITRLPSLYQTLIRHGDLGFNLTFDTEHSFASGWHPETQLTDAEWARIGVLHLNAIPPEVQFGSGLDRHSFTPLRICSQGFPHENQWRMAAKLGIPTILERSDYDVIRDDIEFLSSRPPIN